MNGDMIDAGSLSNYNPSQNTLGYFDMKHAGPLTYGRIKDLTEVDFTALLGITKNQEHLGHGFIISQLGDETRLFWHNDVGDSVCWRFLESREVVKQAVMADITASRQGIRK
ncbi:MAG TPA: hypothetical protein ACFYD6_02955 [Candidatus Brocadiia bacterium]|nr:hypothetical protein [Planctomycetota bacterium]MBI4007613.1 hypothetical protein [Planctomycetota bacterium]MDO8093431.1 hypothetical protein [Candidatus Brocadiales bacterium]